MFTFTLLLPLLTEEAGTEQNSCVSVNTALMNSCQPVHSSETLQLTVKVHHSLKMSRLKPALDSGSDLGKGKR